MRNFIVAPTAQVAFNYMVENRLSTGEWGILSNHDPDAIRRIQGMVGPTVRVIHGHSYDYKDRYEELMDALALQDAIIEDVTY